MFRVGVSGVEARSAAERGLTIMCAVIAIAKASGWEDKTESREIVYENKKGRLVREEKKSCSLSPNRLLWGTAPEGTTEKKICAPRVDVVCEDESSRAPVTTTQASAQ